MVFPQDPLPVVVQAKINGTTWTDITGYTYVRDLITIDRGYDDEQSQATPTEVKCVLNNRDGRFSPRNPTGPYYGQLGRNTELRVGITEATGWLDVPGPTGAVTTAQHVSTPDTAALDLTGDADIRFDADLDSWRESLELVSKNTEAGNQRSYALRLGSTGRLEWYFSADGISFFVAVSTVPVPIVRGRIAVRVTFDADNGVGGRTSTFYYSTSMSGSWTQLGTALGGTSPITLFSGSSPVTVLDNPGSSPATPTAIRGRVYGAEIRSAIGGTIVAKPDFTVATPGAGSFVDSTGKTWTLNGPVSITRLNVRGHGEVSAWPQRWDMSQRDVWSPIVASGITRRLGQGASSLASPMYRGMTSGELTDIVAYWPVEDKDGSSSIASGLSNGRPMSLASTDNASFGSSDVFPGSDPVAVLGDRSSWNGGVKSYTAAGSAQLWWLMQVPTGGLTNNERIIALNFTGTLGHVYIRYVTGGSMSIVAIDDDIGAVIGTLGPYPFIVDGLILKCALNLVQNGSNVDITLQTLIPGATVGSSATGTINSRTFGRVTSVLVSPGGGTPDLALGQISVHKTVYNLFAQGDELNGWRGEHHGRRIERLCREEGIPFRGMGDLDDTIAGNYQESKSVLELLQESADADGGVLSEARDDLSITYVPRSAMQGQLFPTVVLPYDSSRELEPIEDDQSLRNDVTVSRANGSSARVTLDSGRLSTQQPPNGAGRYQASETFSIAFDEQLPDHASWRLHTGTVDEARYPTVQVDLEHPDIAGDPVLTANLRALDLGNRFTITGPFPAWLSPDTIDLLAIGTTESLGVYEHTLQANCLSYRPYRVGTWTDVISESRWETGGSTLSSGITTTATSVSIATPGNPIWTTAAGSFPFPALIGGVERVTVTNITGTTTPQTATVVRSVNGVVKSHLAGASFGLADVSYWGL